MSTERYELWLGCPDVESQAQKLSGAWVFKGTRIPVSSLFENLEDGARVEDFVSWFPGVSLQQVQRVLSHVALSLKAA